MDSSPRFEPLFYRRYANCAGIPFLLLLFLATLVPPALLLWFLIFFSLVMFAAAMCFSRYRKEFLFALMGLALASVLVGITQSDRAAIDRFAGKEWEGEGSVLSASVDEIEVKLRLDGVFYPVKVTVETEEVRQVGERLYLSLSFERSGESGSLCAQEKAPAQVLGRDLLSYALGKVRVRLQKGMDALPQGAFFRAILLGDRSGLSADVKEAFRRTASSHLLAISGLHVTQILWFVHLFLSLFPLSGKGRRILLLCSLPLLFLLTGGSVSVFRASFMAAFPLLGGLIRRRSDSVTALVLAGVLLCTFDPDCIIDPSFVLSFFATFSILIASAPFCLWLWEDRFAGKGSAAKFLFGILSSFVISVFSFTFLFPFQILLFGEGEFLAPLFALILIPLFPLCLLAGVVSSFLLLLPISASVFLSPLSSVAQWFLSLVQILSRSAPPTVNVSSVLTAFSLLLILSFLLLSRRRIHRLFLLYIGMFLWGIVTLCF